jgi:hypothetical protein
MVKVGGWLHFYTFKKRDQIEALRKSYEDMGLKVMQCPSLRQCGAWCQPVGLRYGEILNGALYVAMAPERNP